MSLVISIASRDHLWSGTSYLVIADQLLQLISVNDDVKTTQLCQAELLPIHAGKAHLGEGRPGSVSILRQGTAPKQLPPGMQTQKYQQPGLFKLDSEQVDNCKVSCMRLGEKNIDTSNLQATGMFDTMERRWFLHYF